MGLNASRIIPGVFIPGRIIPAEIISRLNHSRRARQDSFPADRRPGGQAARRAGCPAVPAPDYPRRTGMGGGPRSRTLTVLMLLELPHRGQAIRDARTQRRAFRRRRRGNLRYRHARLDNRAKPEGWPAPSLRPRHLVDTTMTRVRRMTHWISTTALSQELVRFDTQTLSARAPKAEATACAISHWPVVPVIHVKAARTWPSSWQNSRSRAGSKARKSRLFRSICTQPRVSPTTKSRPEVFSGWRVTRSSPVWNPKTLLLRVKYPRWKPCLVSRVRW
jgi:hypothetical protein